RDLKRRVVVDPDQHVAGHDDVFETAPVPVRRYGDARYQLMLDAGAVLPRVRALEIGIGPAVRRADRPEIAVVARANLDVLRDIVAVGVVPGTAVGSE